MAARSEPNQELFEANRPVFEENSSEGGEPGQSLEANGGQLQPDLAGGFASFASPGVDEISNFWNESKTGD